MSFTTVSLSTQQLLETTFISDMRLITNSNIAVLKGKLEEIINTLEIDLTNKYIGVDNYVNQVKTNDLVLGNGIFFMNSTTQIGSLEKVSGFPNLSKLTIDQLVIKPGGSIDMYGTAGNTMTLAITRLGVGIPLSSIVADGFYVGSASLPVKSEFHGEASFSKQSITQSIGDTEIATLISGTDYYGILKLTKTSSQFIYLTIKAPVGEIPASTTPITIFTYEDSTNIPEPGQTFTLIIKDYQNSTGTSVAIANWGDIRIAQGYTSTNGIPILINGGVIGAAATVAAALTALSTTNYIKAFNTNIQSTSLINQYAVSVSLSKYANLTSQARYIISNSSNIELIN